MRFLSKIYCCHYFFYLEQKNFFRGTIFRRSILDVDFHAVGLLLLSHIFIMIDLLTFANKYISFNFSLGLVILLVILIPIGYLEYRYFTSNGERRRNIIEHYRESSAWNKYLWNIVAISTIVLPIVIFFMLIP